MIPGMFSGLASRALRLLPPEAAHRVAVRALAMGLGPNIPNDRHGKRMEVKVAGLTFPNPLGLAAGFDKDCEAMAGAFGLGFGFVEVGTITPLPQPGNPKPRVFRLPEDGAVINRYGFNSAGVKKAAERLAEFRKNESLGILGINIGANKNRKKIPEDYRQAAKRLAQYADYIVVNVSSPNTQRLRGGLKHMLLTQVLNATLTGMAEAKAERPLMLKLSPDLSDAELKTVVKIALKKNCAGLIVSNTTIERPSSLSSRYSGETGGLSGVPLFEKSTEMLFQCRKIVPKNFILIAAGGVCDASTAYAKILAGANLVQLYTGLALGNPDLPERIVNELVELLNQQGFSSIQEAVGAVTSIDEAYLKSGYAFQKRIYNEKIEINESKIQFVLSTEITNLHRITGEPVSLRELPYWQSLDKLEKIKQGRAFKKMVEAGDIDGIQIADNRVTNSSAYIPIKAGVHSGMNGGIQQLITGFLKDRQKK